MEYEVVKEESINEGRKEVWYLVEPRNWFRKVIHKLTLLEYDPHQNKEEAIRVAQLKSKDSWDKTLSRKRIIN